MRGAGHSYHHTIARPEPPAPPLPVDAATATATAVGRCRRAVATGARLPAPPFFVRQNPPEPAATADKRCGRHATPAGLKAGAAKLPAELDTPYVPPTRPLEIDPIGGSATLKPPLAVELASPNLPRPGRGLSRRDGGRAGDVLAAAAAAAAVVDAGIATTTTTATAHHAHPGTAGSDEGRRRREGAAGGELLPVQGLAAPPVLKMLDADVLAEYLATIETRRCCLPTRSGRQRRRCRR